MNDNDINQMLSKSSSDEDFDEIKKHCSQLMGRFDSVQIFVTKEIRGEHITRSADWGDGNWFSRYGQVSLWKKAVDSAEINNH